MPLIDRVDLRRRSHGREIKLDQPKASEEPGRFVEMARSIPALYLIASVFGTDFAGAMRCPGSSHVLGAFVERFLRAECRCARLWLTSGELELTLSNRSVVTAQG